MPNKEVGQLEFPVMIKIGSISIHPHFLFETLSYFIGFRLYLWTRSKDRLPMQTALWILVGAVLGAALGSKVLYWLEDPVQTGRHLFDPVYLMEGKTIVGALLGGLLGVELTKKATGWKRRTGDDYVIPLIVGMMIGRVGCFLTGLSDHTYGTPTGLWTGVDFGDGVPRHPTQLYEIAFLLVLLVVILSLRKRKALAEGGSFQLFMLCYLTFRLLIDFIKPFPHVYGGLNAIQLACIVGMVHYIRLIARWRLAAEEGTASLTAENAEGGAPHA